MINWLQSNDVAFNAKLNNIELIKVKMFLIKRFNGLKLKLKRFFYINVIKDII